MRWEYKTEQIKLPTSGFLGTRLRIGDVDEILNRYGRQGWELVSFQTHRNMHGMAFTLAVFRRSNA